MATTFNGQLGVKSSALAPTSSKLTSQYIVLDHMKNHYRKLATVKSAIDSSVPKSIEKSQKVRERTNRTRAVSRSGSRPQSRAESRAYDTHDGQVNGVYHYDEWGEPEGDEESQVYTIMRDVLHPPRHSDSNQATIGSGSMRRTFSLDNTTNHDVHHAPLGKTLQWPSSARSNESLHSTNTVRSHKKRDGDLLATRAHAFTEPQKPFTPRTLKTDRQSKLSEYRYYNPPKKQLKTAKKSTPTEKSTGNNNERVNLNKTTNLNSTKISDSSMMLESLATRDFNRQVSDNQQLGVPPLDISIDADNLNWLKDQASQAKQRMGEAGVTGVEEGLMEKVEVTTQEREPRARHSILKSRKETERPKSGEKSWAGRRLNAEKKKKRKALFDNGEEELKYVEFVRDVTNDILARGIYTNRVLLQVFENHLQRRLHDLDEEKMRSKLRTLRLELGIPSEKAQKLEVEQRNTLSSALRDLDTKNLGHTSAAHDLYTGKPGHIEHMTKTHSKIDDIDALIGNLSNNETSLGETYDIKRYEKNLETLSEKSGVGNHLDDVNRNVLYGRSETINFASENQKNCKVSDSTGDTFQVTSTWHSTDNTLDTISRDITTDDLSMTKSFDECTSEFGTLNLETENGFDVNRGDVSEDIIVKEKRDMSAVNFDPIASQRRKKPKLKPRMKKQDDKIDQEISIDDYLNATQDLKAMNDDISAEFNNAVDDEIRESKINDIAQHDTITKVDRVQNHANYTKLGDITKIRSTTDIVKTDSLPKIDNIRKVDTTTKIDRAKPFNDYTKLDSARTDEEVNAILSNGESKSKNDHDAFMAKDNEDDYGEDNDFEEDIEDETEENTATYRTSDDDF